MPRCYFIHRPRLEGAASSSRDSYPNHALLCSEEEQTISDFLQSLECTAPAAATLQSDPPGAQAIHAPTHLEIVVRNTFFDVRPRVPSVPRSSSAPPVLTKWEVPQPRTVRLHIQDQLGNEMQLTSERAAPMQELMETYCARKGDAVDSVLFMLDAIWEHLLPDDTADRLCLEDGDIITVVRCRNVSLAPSLDHNIILWLPRGNASP